ncbi:dynein axonemal assembly factor 6-like [Amphiura filiformis]|uniref:dynein axonemal assembly factor 6-like n=1 Tax=Amphiura filiformis TaxID=82378 RepID=UPI003B21E9C2
MEFGGVTLNALADLLKPQEDDNSDNEDQPVTAAAKLGPGSIGPPKKQQPKQEKKSDSKDIWNAEEVPEGSEFEDDNDPRPQPEYDIVFKQAVSTEDMFLQMGNKTPSSVCCEDIVVKINLPDTKLADVDLDVKDKFLACRTPKYKLGLHLPHPVDSKNGKAQWDGTKELLTVTLRMTREYDFLTN